MTTGRFRATRSVVMASLALAAVAAACGSNHATAKDGGDHGDATSGSASSSKLPVSPTYTQAEVCLNPAMAGQTVSVELTLSGNATCGLQPSESAWFDDFAVTTSAACPGQ